MIFVDTSVLVGTLRGHRSAPIDRLAVLESSATPYAIPMMCCQEVLQGAANEREWRLLRANLATQRLVIPADPIAVHWEAARIFFDCRRRGLTVRSSVDCLIAAIAIENRVPVWHRDRDFTAISRYTPLETL